MSTVADAARPVGAAPPPVRHGTCRLDHPHPRHSDYRLRPCPPESGILAAWSLRKLDHGRLGPLLRRRPQGPARPLHLPGSRAVRAGRASTSAPSPPPASSRPEAAPGPHRRPARARQLHAKNARQAIGQAQGHAPKPAATSRRSLPHRRPCPKVAARRRLPLLRHGFRQAVSAHVARIGRGGYEICDGCGAEFDIEISGDPNFCDHACRRR